MPPTSHDPQDGGGQHSALLVEYSFESDRVNLISFVD